MILNNFWGSLSSPSRFQSCQKKASLLAPNKFLSFCRPQGHQGARGGMGEGALGIKAWG